MVQNMGIDRPEGGEASGRRDEREQSEDCSAAGLEKEDQRDDHLRAQRYGHRGHWPVGESDNRFDSDPVFCSSGRWCHGWLGDGWHSDGCQRQAG